MIRKDNPRYKKDRKFEKAKWEQEAKEFDKRMEVLLEKYKVEIKRQAGSRGFDVFDSFGGRDEADMDSFVKIVKGGQAAYDDYVNELQEYNMEYINNMSSSSITEFLKDEGMDSDEIEGLKYSAQWDEFRSAFEEHLNYNIKTFFDYDVLLREKKSYEVGYDGANNFISKDDPEQVEFQTNALKYISPLQFNEILNNSYGGVGYFGIIISAMDVLEAIRDDKKTVSSRDLVIGIHDGMNGSGYFKQAKTSEPYTVNLEGARLDHGSYSIGDVFGSVDWKWK